MFIPALTKEMHKLKRSVVFNTGQVKDELKVNFPGFKQNQLILKSSE